MRPTEAESLFGRGAGQQSIEEAGGKTVTATDAVEHIKLTRRSLKRFAIDPGDGAPVVPIGRVNLAERGGDNLHIRQLFGDLVHHAKEGRWIELVLGLHLRPAQPESLL